MNDHVARNRASRERLAALIARLGERTVVLPDGWTAAALLGHLAFWDRFAATHLQKYLRNREPMVFYDDAFFELVNAAGTPPGNATPLGPPASAPTLSLPPAAAANPDVGALTITTTTTLGPPVLL